jgi:hypothetical protein
MASKYSSSLPIVGAPTLTFIRINGVNYAVNIVLDNGNPALAQDVKMALNALGFGAIFHVIILGGETMVITTDCTEATPEWVRTVDEIYNFSETEECSSAVVATEITVDCEDLECLLFKDVTGRYSPTNTNGYGTPNYPGFQDFDKVKFTLTIGEDDYQFNDSGYLPNISGTSEICLTPANFGLDEFPKGELATLVYTLVLKNETEIVVDDIPEFRFPCCGESIGSNLGTDFQITEKNGATSIVFEDTTGDYDADDNPGGYGAPNPTYADIVSTLIKFTKSDGTVVNITSFVPTALAPSIEISAADLGETDTIKPQIISVEYSVYIAGTCRVGYKSEKVLFHWLLNKCIRDRGITLLKSSCAGPCNDEAGEVDRVHKLINRYEMMLIVAKTNLGCIEDEVTDLYKDCIKDCPACQ